MPKIPRAALTWGQTRNIFFRSISPRAIATLRYYIPPTRPVNIWRGRRPGSWGFRNPRPGPWCTRWRSCHSSAHRSRWWWSPWRNKESQLKWSKKEKKRSDGNCTVYSFCWTDIRRSSWHLDIFRRWCQVWLLRHRLLQCSIAQRVTSSIEGRLIESLSAVFTQHLKY